MTSRFQKNAKKNFWQPGNYKKTTKRIKNGYKLTNDLRRFFRKRAEIEENYSKELRNWVKYCGTVLDRGPEYGTTRYALKGIIAEAECLSEIHSRVKTRLNCGEFQELGLWQQYYYTPGEMGIHQKFDDLFKQLQKPWTKLLKKVEKAKSNYHKRCEKHRILSVQTRYALAEANLRSSQKQKLQQNVEKSNMKVQKCRERYKRALQKLSDYQPIYANNMTTIYMKCQEMEEHRLTIIKCALYSVHRALNIIQDQSLSQIYKEFYNNIENINYEKDLDWWSQNYGANMPIKLPSFVEYPEIRKIALGLENAYRIIESPLYTNFNRKDLSTQSNGRQDMMSEIDQPNNDGHA